MPPRKPALERILAHSTKTRLRGLASGALVTALVQSSSAVTVAIIGFVNAGLLTLGQSMWVLFGVNVGTTMTGWLVALVWLKFKIELLALRLSGEGKRCGAPGTARAEWDTLFFFYGVVMCVGVLGFIGYLGAISQVIYGGWGATNAHIAIGLISAVVDNIPVMFAVLTMMPDMSVGQRLLVTLTAGVGGSMLSISSATGVALMGQARGFYTFFGHLKWTPAIALGYAASIAVHMLFNRNLF